MPVLEPSEVDWAKYAQFSLNEQTVKSAGEYKADTIKQIRDGADGPVGLKLPWGKVANDVRIRHGDVCIIAGINGHRKSMIMNHIFLNFMLQEEKVLVCSMEMTPVDTLERMSYQAAGNGSPGDRILDDVFSWLDERMWIYNQLGTVHSSRIFALVRLGAELGCKQFLFDCLAKIGGVDTNDNEQVKWFMNELTSLATALKVTIHVVHHLAKGESEKIIPNKMNVKGAGELTDLCDMLFLAWLNISKEEKLADLGRGEVAPEKLQIQPDQIFHVAKNRHGKFKKKIRLWFHEESLQFLENFKYGGPNPSYHYDFASSGEYDL